MSVLLRRLRAAAGRFLRRVKPRYQVSYAQCGEDIIIQYVFDALGATEIRYLDIGAHHPTYLSNTYFFYLNGHRGVCIEPDASLVPAFKRERHGDKVVSIGVGPDEGTADFFVLTTPTLNTFSRAEAERVVSYGHERIERTERVVIRNINAVITENFSKPPNLLSLDVEGLDLTILQSLDFSQHAPAVICVETLSYTEDRSERKLTDIIEFVCAHGYFVYADTFVNSIFVRTDAWRARSERSSS